MEDNGRKRSKNVQNFRWWDIIYENPNKSITKLLKMVGELYKVGRYKSILAKINCIFNTSSKQLNLKNRAFIRT